MNKKLAMELLLISFIVISTVTAVYAARDDEETCIIKPAEGISVASISGGASYIIAGGTGPIIILVVAFIIGLVVSHLVWGGF